MPIQGVTSSSDGRQPSAPTIGSASAGNGQATITFTGSSYLGKPDATTYRVIAYNTSNSATGQTATNSSSPITITGLSNGTTYRFTVRLEGVENSAESSFSNDVTPVAPPNFAITPNFATPNFPNFPNFATPNFPNFATPNFPNFPNFATPNFPNFPNFATPNFAATPNFGCTPGSSCLCTYSCNTCSCCPYTCYRSGTTVCPSGCICASGGYFC